MSALESMIMVSCIGLTGNAHDACMSATLAAAKQTGVETNVNGLEKAISEKADRKAKYLLGETNFSIGSGMVFVTKSVVEKSVNLRFPAFMPNMYFSTQIGPQKSLLGIEWKFK